ncbi:MAG TPA: hypothetical protein VNN10_06460 [Dehalococcoidia bacterium]|nr:hypothetical protein [Dehalococcoidia bacterium]
MARLYHFSEEAGIERFAPRPPLAHPEQEPLVWAVDEWHSPHYFLPRDCPRVCFWARPESSPSDVGRMLGLAARAVVIERAWLPAVREAVLYRYEFDADGFDLVDETAGYYACRHAVRPVRVQRLENPPALFPRHGVDFRAVDDLIALHLAIVASTLAFSSIRLRNAGGERAEGRR